MVNWVVSNSCATASAFSLTRIRSVVARTLVVKHKGFTLVEVLVALVVMSVGILGIAALYLEGLRAGRTALYRTTAVNLAADMVDRIRANPNARLAYAGTGPGADGGCVNGPVNCTAEQLADDDWCGWSNQLAAQLPAGARGEIGIAGATPVTYTITVAWPEIGQEEPATYSLGVQQ
ncbi:MAG: type IV pilus modification protein PilV [Gammaproteobacteria bacterium]|nr:type IV pilus modification protein PilV [Gammaproteobacteria bacterium]